MRKLALVIALCFSLGCAFQITSDGLQIAAGDSDITTCGPLPDPSSYDATASRPEGDCSTINGGTISTQFAGVLTPLFTLIGKLLPIAL